MTSAAIVGRAIRHDRNKETGHRVSGPLVPPAQYKGRPRTPSHVPPPGAINPATGRPYSPAQMSYLEEKRSQFTPTREFYPHPAHRGGDKREDVKKKEDEPKLRCTWHCFCVALKALSGGIVLLILGTIMSVVGFFAEPLASEYERAENGTLVPKIDPDTKSSLHNLTYVGPVIMGLGGIVVVAACVLTFEVRDTLGVKVVPVKPEVTKADTTQGTSTSITITANNNRKNTLNSSSSDSTPGKARPTASHLTLPLATISDMSAPSGTNVSVHNFETIQETSFSEDVMGSTSASSSQRKSSKTSAGGVVSSDGSKKFAHIQQQQHQQLQQLQQHQQLQQLQLQQQVSESRQKRYSIADENITSPSSGMSHMLSPNIDTYFGIPSPQETELSDPDGCSLVVPSRWKSSRCSCSGSPTHSFELYMDDHEREISPPKISISVIERQEYLLQQQRLQQYQLQSLQRQQQLIQQQIQSGKQPTIRRPKVLASMESDGLSSVSVSSSSSEEIYLGRKAQQYVGNYVANVHASVKVHTPYKDRMDHGQSGVVSSSHLVKPTLSSLVSASSTVSTSSPATTITPANTKVDKRFPLLRTGVLGNGSVPSGTR